MSVRDYSRRLFCNIKWRGLRYNPSCLYSSTDTCNGLLTRFMPFCLLLSGYLIVCFVHLSVYASVQLEMHMPENTNKIICFHMGVVRLLVHGIARKMGASN